MRAALLSRDGIEVDAKRLADLVRWQMRRGRVRRGPARAYRVRRRIDEPVDARGAASIGSSWRGAGAERDQRGLGTVERPMSFSIGPYALAAPVVLAPMAGVTNAPFRELCRRYAPGLVYVNEMVMATPVVHGNAQDRSDDQLRRRRAPAQPAAVRVRPADHGPGGAQAVRRRPRRPHRHQLRLPGRQGHPPWRRRGGAGTARTAPGDPARRGRRTPRRTACRSPPSSGWACSTTGSPTSDTGEVCAEEGVAAIALHARTVAAALLRRGALGRDRRAEAGRRIDPGARQRRHLGGRRRRADDGGHRLRRRRDRSRLPRSSVVVRRPRRGVVRSARAREPRARRW